MKLLGRKGGDSEQEPADTGQDVTIEAARATLSGTTAPKGRPTPKRDEGRRRGPVAPAPTTSAEARARRKALAGPKLSRAERKVASTERRARMADSRERMMAGDEKYLTTRDQGPVRRYVRDWVDSRRHLLGLFIPAAFVLILISFGAPQLQYYMSPAMLIMMVLLILDGVWLARKVCKAVDAKFPDSTESRWRLGFYAAMRASQLRRMRAPRPQVKPGDSID